MKTPGPQPQPGSAAIELRLQRSINAFHDFRRELEHHCQVEAVWLWSRMRTLVPELAGQEPETRAGQMLELMRLDPAGLRDSGVRVVQWMIGQAITDPGVKRATARPAAKSKAAA